MISQQLTHILSISISLGNIEQVNLLSERLSHSYHTDTNFYEAVRGSGNMKKNQGKKENQLT